MDKVYYQYRDSLMNATRIMDDSGTELEGDSLGMGVIRKEVDLTNEEKQYLLAVERGDIPSTRQYLAMISNGANININCVDPLGRTALLIAIENENIEMIELLLAHNIEVGDALLHAINEENVEAVELILNHEVQMKGEEMGVFKGRKRKGLSLSYKKRKYASYTHLKLYRSAKKSVKHSKPLKSSTPCLHKTVGNTLSKNKIKRKIYSTTKVRAPFKSPLLKKARTMSPKKRLNVSMFSPVSTLDCKTRTPRKSKRTLNYNETPVSKPMANEFYSNTDSLINKNKVDETILYSDGEMSDRSFDTDDSSHDLKTIKQMSDDDIRFS